MEIISFVLLIEWSYYFLPIYHVQKVIYSAKATNVSLIKENNNILFQLRVAVLGKTNWCVCLWIFGCLHT